MEAQRLSLSQIHAAQFELLQEETEALTHSLELKLQQQSGRGDPGEEIHHRSPDSSLCRFFGEFGLLHICKSLFWLFFSWAKTPSEY